MGRSSPVRAAHVSVLVIVNNCSTQYSTEQIIFLLIPGSHHRCCLVDGSGVFCNAHIHLPSRKYN